MKSVKARIRLKKRDRKVIGDFVRVEARVPLATGKRRVGIRLHMKPGQQRADPDAYWKSTLDALVAHGLLIDDSPQWCELSPVEYDPERVPGGMATTITLEDVG